MEERKRCFYENAVETVLNTLKPRRRPEEQVMETYRESNVSDRKTDYASVKSILSGLYADMVKYIETFRMIYEGSTEDDSKVLMAAFVDLYISLVQKRLDLPDKLFNSLYSFSIYYLQHMFCWLKYIEEYPLDENFCLSYPTTAEESWDLYKNGFSENYGTWNCSYVYIDFSGKYSYLFKDVMMQEFDYIIDSAPGIHQNECFISDKAYGLLDEILGDYILE